MTPDHSFRREANAQTVARNFQQSSAIEQVMKYAQKDDLLLYITAAFGICMPAVMYFFYKTMHAKYHAYQARINESKRKKFLAKRSKRTITIFYSGSRCPTKKIAYNLAEELDRFDPIVANLSSSDIHRRIKSSSKTVFIFIVLTDITGKISPVLSAFLDWLDEIRYEHRQKSFFQNCSFAIFGIGPLCQQANSNSTNCIKNKAAITLFSRLSSMKGHTMYEASIAADLQDAEDIDKKLRFFAMDLTKSLKQFQCGAFDETIHSSDEGNLNYNESNEVESTEDECISSAESYN